MGTIMPKCLKKGYAYIDQEEKKWKIKDDAPEWAKKEFEEFMKAVNPVADENGIITRS